MYARPLHTMLIDLSHNSKITIMTITKSDFLTFLDCPSDFWFLKKFPIVRTETVPDEFTRQLMLQGQEVEHEVRKTFPGGKYIFGDNVQASEQTRKLIIERTATIFQATFLVDGLLSKVDILQYNKLLNAWDMYEVKATSQSDKSWKKHLPDMTFQKIVAEKSGLKIANVYLIEVNKTYVKMGDIDLDELFVISEKTTEVLDMEEQISVNIYDAQVMVSITTEPSSCDCKYKSRKKQCNSFNHLFSNVPAYSIYDIARIGVSKKKLAALVDEDALLLSDVRDDHNLSNIQMNQCFVEASGHTIEDRHQMEGLLDQLEYPLYFLDYETLSSAIPKFDETKPYQQVPFQYSLHIQTKPGGEYIHKEFLHDDTDTPVHVITERLREDIGDHGSVIVWNKSFECMVNRDLAEVNPHLSEFLLGLNDRVFDLMHVFSKQYYVHKGFKGRTSIKSVLPVLCPELSYKTLTIQDGGAATTHYRDLIFTDMAEEERHELKLALLQYCKLDTWAMVEIFNFCKSLVSTHSLTPV